MSDRWRPKHNPWAIAVTVTVATFMEVLDTSIANVALPHISGTLGAGQSEASWVISSYLVANAVILPISGYLATLIGRKRFYMSCVIIFGISSLLCGICPLRFCGRPGARDWTSRRRLDHGQFQLALDLFHQRAGCYSVRFSHQQIRRRPTASGSRNQEAAWQSWSHRLHRFRPDGFLLRQSGGRAR